MARVLKRASKKAGLPPGSLIHVGETKDADIIVEVIQYDHQSMEEAKSDNITNFNQSSKKFKVNWINIDGLQRTELIETLGAKFELHALLLEDILNTGQRPKTEDYGVYLFTVLKMISYNDLRDKIEIEQVSIVIGDNYLLSFQEQDGDVFEPVRNRLRNSKGKIRSFGPDYLAYTLLDAVVDNYFVVLEKLDEKIEALEEELLFNPTSLSLQKIYRLKRELIMLRKSAWPLREAVGNLERAESPLIQETTAVFFRDVYDHIIRVIDTIETFQDLLSGLLDIYLSSVSNRLNEVMKVLTVISTIFIPLTFVVGVYGMNFKHMPEIQWRFGYWAVWLVMVLIGGGMLLFFKRKKWL